MNKTPVSNAIFTTWPAWRAANLCDAPRTEEQIRADVRMVHVSRYADKPNSLFGLYAIACVRHGDLVVYVAFSQEFEAPNDLPNDLPNDSVDSTTSVSPLLRPLQTAVTLDIVSVDRALFNPDDSAPFPIDVTAMYRLFSICNTVDWRSGKFEPTVLQPYALYLWNASIRVHVP